MKQATKWAVFWKSGGFCWYCGCAIIRKARQKREAATGEHFMCVDHIRPRARGGGNEIENLAPTCQDCNHAKGDLDLEEFRIECARRAASVPEFTPTQLNWLRSKGVDPHAGLKPFVFWFERQEAKQQARAAE